MFIAGIVGLIVSLLVLWLLYRAGHTSEGADFVPHHECDHIFFPESDPPIGQKCSLCGKFNSLEDLGIKEPNEWLKQLRTEIKDRNEQTLV